MNTSNSFRSVICIIADGAVFNYWAGVVATCDSTPVTSDSAVGNRRAAGAVPAIAVDSTTSARGSAPRPVTTYSAVGNCRTAGLAEDSAARPPVANSVLADSTIRNSGVAISAVYSAAVPLYSTVGDCWAAAFAFDSAASPLITISYGKAIKD